MANKEGRRGFGNVRKLPSGKWQARYPGPDGKLRPAPDTFDSKRAAEQWLSRTEALILGGEWTNPDLGKILIQDYAERWITQRPALRPLTVNLYRWLLAKYIVPGLGGVQLGKLSTAMVREWRANLLGNGVSETMAAKAYRLLRAVLNTAVEEDRILPRNPCKVKGADKENPAERPVVSVAQVFALADRVPARFRALILLTAFATLRWGEVSALRRCDVAPDGSWVRVNFAHTEVKGRGIVVGPPKSRAGVRTLAVPVAIRHEVVKHLSTYVKAANDALLFTREKGGPVRSGNFYQRTKWTRTVAKLGIKGLHFHDLRHSGNVWAAQAGTSTKDLMARMGHDDMRAALIYQRATSEADRQIADRLSGLIDKHRSGGEDEDGAAGALVPAGHGTTRATPPHYGGLGGGAPGRGSGGRPPEQQRGRHVCALRRHDALTLERVTRIELAPKAWEAFVLPLNYTRRTEISIHNGAVTASTRGDVRLCPVLLSDRDLRKELEGGRLVLEPYDSAMVQPSSIDVRLDRYFRVFNNIKYTHIDPQLQQDDLTSLVEPDGEEPFVLHPGEFVLGSTYERVSLPDDLAGRLEGKSSLGRLGLLTHSTAGFIDPGFTGHITLELSNVSNLPIKLWPGMKIGQLCLFRLESPAEYPYGSARAGSRYQGQRGPTPSRAYLNFHRVNTQR
ncbi:hypothetical protein GCM10010174_26380 [Kutzneria viridogrisea]